ncbi:MAG TPA: hypothetical protein VD907_04495 [Verrucomicrobiae bacterium]|nr:hypothetical protein [Verrucomicrobiae bacterium]
MSEASQKRKLDMHKLPDRQAITVQCTQLDISTVDAAELLRSTNFVEHLEFSKATITVYYNGCSLERIKQNVFMKLESHIKTD